MWCPSTPAAAPAPESTRLVSAGQKYGTLPTAVKEGCAFVGWFTQPEGGQQITANSTTGGQQHYPLTPTIRGSIPISL